jgi:hypothetical protein
VINERGHLCWFLSVSFRDKIPEYFFGDYFTMKNNCFFLFPTLLLKKPIYIPAM